MNRKVLTVVFALALMIAAGCVWAGPAVQQHSAPVVAANNNQTMTTSGKITAATDSSFTLEVKKESKGEKESATETQLLEFVINSSTKLEGKLEVGAVATVSYRTENGKNVATSVTVTPAS